MSKVSFFTHSLFHLKKYLKIQFFYQYFYTIERNINIVKAHKHKYQFLLQLLLFKNLKRLLTWILIFILDFNETFFKRKKGKHSRLIKFSHSEDIGIG